MSIVEVPLQHVLLYTSTTPGSALALPADQQARLWRNLGWTLEPSEHEPDVDRRCKVCDATWVGPITEKCTWCERSAAALIDGQRTLLLAEPDYHSDANNEELQNQINAWANRLQVGVEAALVTSTEADRAVEQWTNKVKTWRSTR